MLGNTIATKVMVESNPGSILIKALEYRHNGKTYVEGVKGRRYEIVVHNLTSGRVEIVSTVDGLDVHDGQPSSYEKRGLVVGPYETATFKGFRLSLEDIATFRFGEIDRAYATRIGKATNIGVIGVAVYKEMVEVPHLSFLDIYPERGDTLGYSPMKGIGTVFGERRRDHVGTTMFTRATNQPVEAFVIRYEDRIGLKTLGISVVEMDENLLRRENANPFPANNTFAKPPVGWRG